MYIVSAIILVELPIREGGHSCAVVVAVHYCP